MVTTSELELQPELKLPWRGGLGRRARGRGSGDGIDRAVLAPRVGGTGAVLATALSHPRGCRGHVGDVALGTSPVGAIACSFKTVWSACWRRRTSRVIDDHIAQLDHEMAGLLNRHQPAVRRLAAVPGLGVDSAQQIIAEVGATAATVPSPSHLASWVGVCPGDKESAGVTYSHRSPHGNRQMRRVLNQAANAAVKTKGSIFELVYRRLVPRLGHAQAIGAIAHRLCRLVWKILHQRVSYEERGPAVTKQRAQRRAAKMIRELRSLGSRVERLTPETGPA